MQSLKIYVAGPYTAATNEEKLENTMRAIDIGIALFKNGHFPYIPHLTHWIDQRAGETNIDLKWDDFIKWDLEWLDLCDALLYTRKSKGADIELEFAKNRGKIIYYSLDEVSDYSIK